MYRFLSTIFLTLAFSAVIFSQQQLVVGNDAPDFTADSYSGGQFNLAQHKGKIVVLTFWSTTCQICHVEIPKMNQVVERYRGKDVVFVALTLESNSKVDSYVKKYPFNVNILTNGFGVVLKYADMDKGGRMNMGFPAYYLIDQNGKIGLRSSGWDKTAALDSQISRLLTSD